MKTASLWVGQKLKHPSASNPMAAIDPTRSMPERLFLSHWGICAREEEGGRIFLSPPFKVMLPCDVLSPQSALFYSKSGSTVPGSFPVWWQLLSTKAHLFPWKWGRGTAEESKQGSSQVSARTFHTQQPSPAMLNSIPREYFQAHPWELYTSLKPLKTKPLSGTHRH